MKNYRYFGSGFGKSMSLLSNLSKCEIECEMFVLNKQNFLVQKTFVFPSAEHCWAAHFILNECDISRLSTGDLSTLENGLNVLLGENIGRQKVKYWQKSGSVGIVAKMLMYRDKQTNVRTRAKKIGIEMSIHPMECYGLNNQRSTVVNIWKKILIAKYSQNIRHRRALLSTNDDHLVEFCKVNPEKQFWAGVVQDGAKTKSGIIQGGKLIGKNFMGNCLMATRKEMKKLM